MPGREFAKHETVNHSEEEWARGYIHTNTVEGFFSIFKREMRGVYQHCSEDHLHRYLDEFASGTATAPPSASTMLHAPSKPLSVPSASG